MLLQYLKEDPRKAVKKLAIQDLKLLAKKAPHMWSRKNIQVRILTYISQVGQITACCMLRSFGLSAQKLVLPVFMVQ